MIERKAASTKIMILDAAEACFAEKGYDGAGIEEISNRSGTNKALIYYHFKNKRGLLTAIYSRVMAEVDELIGHSFSFTGTDMKSGVAQALREVLKFLGEKKGVLKILLMESMKDEESQSFFMELTGLLVKNSFGHLSGESHRPMLDNPKYYMVFEFFTGLIPIYLYAVLGEGWAKYNGIDEAEAGELFIDSFIESHMAHHDWR